VADGSVGARKRLQWPWSKGALLLVTTLTKRKARVNDKDTHQFAGPEKESIHQG